MNSVVMLVAAYGVCFGLMNEKVAILNRVLYALPLFRREEGNFFQRMFKCSYCTGFHAGWTTWTLCFVPALVAGELVWPEFAVGFVAFAFASSAFCYAIDTVIQWFER